MNAKLTEIEYQHMIIELISICIEKIPKFRQSDDVEMTDWIYLLERLKTKGVLSDLRPARDNITDKPKHAARLIMRQFYNERETDITTMM